MKRIVAKVLWIVGVLFILLFAILFENRNELTSNNLKLFFKVGDEVVCPWYSEAEDVYYLFLPSHAEIEKVKLTTYSEKFIYLDDSQDGNYVSMKRKHPLKKDMINRKLDCKREKSGQSYQIQILQSANLPSVFIETSSDSLKNLEESKDYSESGKIRVYSEDGNLLFSDAVSKIKGRGNTSFNGYEKKTWNLIFQKPVDLFHMGKDTKYALVANASDPTLVRNDYMRRLEQALQIPKVSLGQFVDLYINQEYQGNYYLCSPISIGENQINITDLEKLSSKYIEKAMIDTGERYESQGETLRKGMQLSSVDEAIEKGSIDVTGGYLLERDYETRFLAEYDRNVSSFTTKSGECFNVKSPEYCSALEIQYIASFIEEVESAVLAKDGINLETGLSYTDYIDVDCFVKRYLAEEISKNYDGGVSSTFFYKDVDSKDTKLHMAPGWDYDLSLGNYIEWMAEIIGGPEGLTELATNSYPCLWFESLYDKPEYHELIVTYFNQYALPFLSDKTPALIEQYRKDLGASVRMNHIRWADELSQNYQYKDIDTSYSDFQNFIQKRAEFLKTEWGK